MLSNISWEAYLMAAGGAMLLYYIVIGIRLKMFRKDLLSKLINRQKSGSQNFESADGPATQSANSELDELEMVVSDLRYAILDRAGKEADKAVLLQQLQQRLANYAGLRKPAFRVAINNYIVQHAQEICGVAYSVDELNAAWDALPR